ncbi:TIGR03943 family putative permease subunit [Bacillus sp. 7884-1]|uniref:TIGR03943 family putative permease subunit n=1 Tax=Bacillus sp. 7884-1 TaxID=2021693 RepID=UPI000BA6EC6C|nr:TIGR03943 family protein [Bacillus sp. 7884-1]PAE31331.1 TIGR03943 family protein [Bacillus sp. 7884-1]
MSFHFQQAVRAFILLAFSVLLFKLHFTGEMTKFINPKYEGLSQSASVLFLILFMIQTTRIWTVKENSQHHHCHHDSHDHNCSHDHGVSPFNTKKLIAYVIIVFPLVTGFLLPAKVLDASIADKKGGLAVLTNQKSEKEKDEKPAPNNSQQEDPVINGDLVDLSRLEELVYTKDEYNQLIQHLLQSSTIKMNDDIFSTYYDEIQTDIEKFKGREIELKGFVYKEEGLEQDQLVLSRFLITHCVADASIIGFISELPEASSLKENTWIEVKGVLDTTNFNGTELPIIKITTWKKINEPKEPYLYPISVKIL